MPKVLTVDDSRAVRSIVVKSLADLGCEFAEAENGQQGLDVLAQGGIDLVLLDVTMPVMDGPTMLRNLRQRGDETPVLLLTAESKISVVAGMMQDGVSEYILKPFRPEELRAKVLKLMVPRAGAQAPTAPTPAPTSAATPGRVAAGAVPGGAPVPAAAAPASVQADVLLVDAQVNVAAALHKQLPSNLKMAHSVNLQNAVDKCKRAQFRTIIIDTGGQEHSPEEILRTLKPLQPQAKMIGLFLRNVEGRGRMATTWGFDSTLVKPFDAVQVDEFVANYHQEADLLTTQENVVSFSDFFSREETFDKYVNRLSGFLAEAIDQVASACYENAILNLTNIPNTQRLAKMAITARAHADSVGIELRLVAPEGIKKSLLGFQETQGLAIFDSVAAARGQVSPAAGSEADAAG